MSRLEIQLFGPPLVRVDGVPIPPPRTRKGLWALCLLALRAERDVDRTWLAGTLWPDSLQEDALANLRRSLTDLRASLGPAGEMLSGPSLTALRLTGAECDVARFDALVREDRPEGWREAVEIGRQTLLEGCDEEWAVEERTQRETACIELAERLGEAEYAAGRYAEAADWFAETARRDPYREAAWRRRMESLEKAGAFGAAMEAYRALRDQLWEALHTAPSPETTTVYQAIRQAAKQAAVESGKRQAASGSQALAGTTPPLAARHLPLPLTTLIGRESEMEAVCGALRTARMVTLFGSGGVGKTRLAMEAARTLAPEFEDGVAWVELAQVSDPERIAQTVADALSLREEKGRGLLESIANRLADRQMLLVLDNCEHLVETAAVFARELLQRSESVHLLATSRQPLETPGEQVVPLGPFSLSQGADALVEMASQTPAVRLFVERAAARDPSFRLTADNLSSVLRICRHLDGIPLAIELAAARVSLLTVDQIADRLGDRFRLLSSGQRPATPHHRTLRGLVDWSHDLLREENARLFRRLSVFPGGCTLEAAFHVCADPEEDELDTLEQMQALVSRALIHTEDRTGGRRYTMLETLRAYSREKLEASGEQQSLDMRLLGWTREVVEQIPPLGSPVSGLGLLDAVHAEIDNLRQAFSSPACDALTRLALVTRMGRYWEFRGSLTEGRGLLEGALNETAGQGGEVRAAALRVAGNLARLQGDYPGARARLEEAVAAAGALGADHPNGASLRAMANNTLGVTLIEAGDLEGARARLRVAMAAYEECGDVKGVGSALNNLGIVAIMLDDLDDAEVLLLRSVESCRSRNDRIGLCDVLTNLGVTYQNRPEPDRARECFMEAIGIAREQGMRSGLKTLLFNLAEIEMVQANYDEARVLIEEAARITQEMGHRGSYADSQVYRGRIEMFSRGPEEARPFLHVGLQILSELDDGPRACRAIEASAECAVRLGRAREAVRLLGAAARIRVALNYPLMRLERPEVESVERTAREVLGPEGFAKAQTEGSEMEMTEAVRAAGLAIMS